jgi:hypothetical protein
VLNYEQIGMVARDGIAQHYTALTVPLAGIYIDPALELKSSSGRQLSKLHHV